MADRPISSHSRARDASGRGSQARRYRGGATARTRSAGRARTADRTKRSTTRIRNKSCGGGKVRSGQGQIRPSNRRGRHHSDRLRCSGNRLPDPVEAIKFRMEQMGLFPKDLEPIIGRRNRVYEVLNRKRPLTMKMAWRLHSELGIPAESLIRPPGDSRAA